MTRHARPITTGSVAPRDPAAANDRRLLARRAAWTAVDQGISSLTNVVIGFIVAATVSAADFGAFSIAFGVYVVFVGISRAIATDPLLIRHSADEDWTDASPMRAATGLALAVGLAELLLLLVVAPLVGDATGACLLALAVSLPGLLVQDAWRQAFFTQARPAAAALNDITWAIAQVIAVGAVLLLGFRSGPVLLLAWGVAGTAAAFFGVLQGRCWPDPTQARLWLSRHGDINTRLLGEFVLSATSTQGVLIGLGAIVGLSAAGALRGGQLLMGPMNFILMASSLIGMSELVRFHSRRGSIVLGAILISAGTVAMSALWVTVLFLLPARVGEMLLADTWPAARETIPGLSVWAIAISAGVGALSGLRALAAAREALAVRAVVTAVMLPLGLGFGVLWDAPGAAWGMGIALTVGALLWWRSFLKCNRAATVGGATPCGAVAEPYYVSQRPDQGRA